VKAVGRGMVLALGTQLSGAPRGLGWRRASSQTASGVFALRAGPGPAPAAQSCDRSGCIDEKLCELLFVCGYMLPTRAQAEGPALAIMVSQKFRAEEDDYVRSALADKLPAHPPRSLRLSRRSRCAGAMRPASEVGAPTRRAFPW